MKVAAATFCAEFACTRRCQFEMDLDQAPTRYTYNQMLVRAEQVHKEAHRHDYRVFRPAPDTLVRATAAAEALT